MPVTRKRATEKVKIVTAKPGGFPPRRPDLGHKETSVLSRVTPYFGMFISLIPTYIHDRYDLIQLSFLQ